MIEVVGPLPAAMIDTAWPTIGPGLQRACEKTGGDLSSAGLWQAARTGGAFVFVITRGAEAIGASVWRFEPWSELGLTLRCLSLYGSDMSAWFDAMRERAETLARAGGAKGFVMEGRTGWKRKLPKARILRHVFYEELT